MAVCLNQGILKEDWVMKEQAPFDLRYLPLKVSLISLKCAELPPYLGSTLRGVIGQSLYRVDREAYDYLYTNGKKGEGHQDIVKPYVIAPPEISKVKKIVEQGEELEFEFVIIGNAIKYATTLSVALQNISQFGLGAQRYPFILSQIINEIDQRILWWKGNYYRTGSNSSRIPCQILSDVTGAIIRKNLPEVYLLII